MVLLQFGVTLYSPCGVPPPRVLLPFKERVPAASEAAVESRKLLVSATTLPEHFSKRYPVPDGIWMMHAVTRDKCLTSWRELLLELESSKESFAPSFQNPVSFCCVRFFETKKCNPSKHSITHPAGDPVLQATTALSWPRRSMRPSSSDRGFGSTTSVARHRLTTTAGVALWMQARLLHQTSDTESLE